MVASPARWRDGASGGNLGGISRGILGGILRGDPRESLGDPRGDPQGNPWGRILGGSSGGSSGAVGDPWDDPGGILGGILRGILGGSLGDPRGQGDHRGWIHERGTPGWIQAFLSPKPTFHAFCLGAIPGRTIGGVSRRCLLLSQLCSSPGCASPNAQPRPVPQSQSQFSSVRSFWLFRVLLRPQWRPVGVGLRGARVGSK